MKFRVMNKYLVATSQQKGSETMLGKKFGG